jgi:zinc transporter 1/2/3
MAASFALVTPIGMAIGIGVLDFFNGSDPSTIVAIGTLDALSAGILAWVGIVEMLARDWMSGGLLHARWGKTSAAMLSLIAGLVLMSVLGKWA